MIMSRVIPGTPKDMGPPYGKRDPYCSHIFGDSYGSGVQGIVWVPLTIRGSHVLGGSLKIPLIMRFFIFGEDRCVPFF